jgi:hypothetical protein
MADQLFSDGLHLASGNALYVHLRERSHQRLFRTLVAFKQKRESVLPHFVVTSGPTPPMYHAPWRSCGLASTLAIPRQSAHVLTP